MVKAFVGFLSVRNPKLKLAGQSDISSFHTFRIKTVYRCSGIIRYKPILLHSGIELTLHGIRGAKTKFLIIGQINAILGSKIKRKTSGSQLFRLPRVKNS